MRTAAVRLLLVGLATAAAALGAAAPSGAHGGTEIAQGGSDGVRILVNASETTTPAGRQAVDLATTLRGPGTGDGATVTYDVRPSGGDTFRATTTRDEAGIAHTDVPTAGRGEWRDWDVSAVVSLSTGDRLRVSNAEANPPGPEPAATPGGGATGAAPDETTAGEPPSSGGTDPGTADDVPTTGTAAATTDAAPAAGSTTGGAASGTAAGDDGAIEDVSGEDDEGAPTWAIVSVPVILVLAGAAILAGRRRRAADGGEQD